MIEIGDATIVEGKIRQVPIIGVLLNENDFIGTNRFKNAIGDCRLPRTRAAPNTYYHAHKLNHSTVNSTYNSSQQLGKRAAHAIANRHHFRVIDRLVADAGG